MVPIQSSATIFVVELASARRRDHACGINMAEENFCALEIAAR
jgi:hypothetical protein